MASLPWFDYERLPSDQEEEEQEFTGGGQIRSMLDCFEYYAEQENGYYDFSPNGAARLFADPLWSTFDVDRGDYPHLDSVLAEVGGLQNYCESGSTSFFNEIGDAKQDFQLHEGMSHGYREQREGRNDDNYDGRGKRSQMNTSRMLSKEAISQYFYMPIAQAAKELNIGLTLLKKCCRELSIRRWPHRKLTSLQALINNLKEAGGGSRLNAGKIKEVVEMLEREKKLLEEAPDGQLDVKTKRLRQACFKASYQKRKLVGAMDSAWMVSNIFDYLAGPQQNSV